MRRYKSGSRWALWRWSSIEADHIERLHIVKTPWFAICLHWMNGPDASPHEHDHPVSFVSLIVRGGYTESRNGKIAHRRWFNAFLASPGDTHRIIAAKPGTLTLALMGPKVREWGFHTERGWVGWREYQA
jgi:hypothetical protein